MKISFEQAKREYVHRYTCEHVPQWALVCNPQTGDYYAPQYYTDYEWYINTVFPPDNPYHARDCFSSRQTWPLGLRLTDKPNIHSHDFARASETRFYCDTCGIECSDNYYTSSIFGILCEQHYREFDKRDHAEQLLAANEYWEAIELKWLERMREND